MNINIISNQETWKVKIQCFNWILTPLFSWNVILLNVFTYERSKYFDHFLKINNAKLMKEKKRNYKKKIDAQRALARLIMNRTNLLTSSADWAMKNPCVLACILEPLGFIDILLSRPSSPFISIANNRSFSFVKHNLHVKTRTSIRWNFSKS